MPMHLLTRIPAFLILLGSLSGGRLAAGEELPHLQQARQSSEIAGYSLGKVHRWLHEKALPRIDPETGLYVPEGDFNYRDAWADCYPFLVWAAWATDLEALEGPVRGALHAEIRHCPEGFFSREENIFGGSEYVKDGLIAIVEVTGRDVWFDRMRAVQEEIWTNPRIETPFGPIPSTNLEVNGEQIQALVRLFTMTGERKYLERAERIADYYLLQGDFVPQKLRDHGCEIIGGLGLLLGVTSAHHPEKAAQYRPLIRRMLDAIVERGTNPDGIMYNFLDRPDRLSDGWGYNYVSYLCYDLVASQPVYTDRIRHTLKSLSKPLYRDYPWEGNPKAVSIDGFADSIEGALYLVNRLPVPQALEWIDRETARNVVYADEPLESAPLWGTHKLQSNGVRTTLMHALMHSKGTRAQPWQRGLRLGGSVDGDSLYLVLQSDQDWSGQLFFDIPRHRLYMGFSEDWPRMNTLPEWFTVEPGHAYTVHNLDSGSRTAHSGDALHRGLPVHLKAGEELLLRVGP